MITVYVELIKAGRRDLSSVPAFFTPRCREGA
ncbi:CD1375 family protein [Paenibacillus cellulositrophicus]